MLQSCSLKTLKLLFVTVWRAIKPLHSVVSTDLLEVSIMKGIDKYKVCSIINNDKKQVREKLKHFNKSGSMNAILS